MSTVSDAIEHPGATLVVDRRGRSSSGPQGDGYSTQTEADDLRAWLDHLGGQVRLVGWSYRGRHRAGAGRHDPRVRQAIGYDPVLGPFGAELRNSPVWANLCRLARPVVAELEAINAFRPSPG